MKKITAFLFVCMLMIMSVIPAFGAEGVFTLEYIEWHESTGDGHMTVEYLTEKATLNNSLESVEILKDSTVQITIKAEPGSEISAVTYNGTPMSYDRPTTELTMKIDNFSRDVSIKVTYDKAEYLCSTESVGNGKVKITSPATEESSVMVHVGGVFGFTMEAGKGDEILSVSINGEMIDLTRYGKNETNKLSKFSMEIPDVRENTVVSVVFSGSLKYGDVNNDTRVNVKDATEIQKSVAGLSSLDSQQTLKADVDADKKVSVKDATAVQKYVAGIITIFPAESN